MTISPRPGSASAPTQARRSPCVVPPPLDRVVRQVEAVDAWNVARREREAGLATVTSRDDRLVADRQHEALRRTHQAIASSTAEDLARVGAPRLTPAPTAVIAHRQQWFADKVGALLEAHGVTVLARTDNGADALGAVIAGQPDVLLAGDRLSMTSSESLLRDCRTFAPQTWRAVQVSGQAEGSAWLHVADVAFLRLHPPAVIADALLGLMTVTGVLRRPTGSTSPSLPTGWTDTRSRTVRPLDVASDDAQLLCDTCGAHAPFLSDLPIVFQIRDFSRRHRHEPAPADGMSLR